MRRARSVRLHGDQLQELLTVLRSPNSSRRVALRAAVVIRASEGATNLTIARELGTSAATASLWRRRFIRHGTPGLLRDAPRPGRPAVVPGSVVQSVLRLASQLPSPGHPRRSARGIAQALGVSKSTVQRILQAHDVRPRTTPSTSGSDREMVFLDRVTDLVGLYVNPPERAVAFSTDERMRPNPFRRGDLGAAGVMPLRSRGAEFLAFLQMTERETPTMLDVHLLVDSRLSPVPPEAERWLSRRPRFHLHFLHSDRVGLTLIDRLIDGFSRRKDRPGASASAHRLKYALREHLRRDRDTLSPFVWTAASGDIRGAYGRRAIQQ